MLLQTVALTEFVLEQFYPMKKVDIYFIIYKYIFILHKIFKDIYLKYISYKRYILSIYIL